MFRLSYAFVLGYHGCDQSVAEELLSGKPFKASENDYDWLGPGTYFWEANLLRGLEFAKLLATEPWGSKVQNPAVVGAVIDLGLCLDTTTSAAIRHVRRAYDSYVSTCKQAEVELPVNKPESDPFIRRLDCAVFRQVHEIRENDGDPKIETVRGVFTEGEPVFENAGFLEKTHIQICVCEPSNIKGVFRVPEDQLK